MGRRLHILGWNPIRKRCLYSSVSACRRVLLINGSQPFWREPIRDPDKSRPEPTMDKRDLAVDETGRYHVGGTEHLVDDIEDLVTGPVPPPAAPDRLARDELGEIRDQALGRLQHDSLVTHPLERLQSLSHATS